VKKKKGPRASGLEGEQKKESLSIPKKFPLKEGTANYDLLTAGGKEETLLPLSDNEDGERAPSTARRRKKGVVQTGKKHIS